MPPDIPKSISGLIVEGWSPLPSQRPSFSQILEHLDDFSSTSFGCGVLSLDVEGEGCAVSVDVDGEGCGVVSLDV